MTLISFTLFAGVLKGDTLVPFLFIICLYYEQQTSIDLMKENSFTLKNTRSRWHPIEKDNDDADDLVLYGNIHVQVESLLEQVARDIGPLMNSDKTVIMCSKQMYHSHDTDICETYIECS